MAGSLWNRWDLHLHTPGTKKADRFGELSLKEFARHISKTDLVAVGITDYYSVDNAFRMKEELKILGSDIVVFPNMELRESYIANKSRLNYHVIFSDTLSEDEVRDALKRLRVKSGTDQNLYVGDLTDQQIQGAIADIKDVRDQLNHEFQGVNPKPFMIVSASGSDGFRARDESPMSKTDESTILSYCDAIFGNRRDLEYWLNKPEGRNRIFPVFKGSDAHSLEDFEEALDNKEFTWIKGLPCFQSLWECSVDPWSRIRLQTSKPDEKSKGRVIETVNIKAKRQAGSDTLFDQTIKLNPNLNTIIGARSSGKSILASAIATSAGLEHVEKQQSAMKRFSSDGAQNGPAPGWPWGNFFDEVSVDLGWDDGTRSDHQEEANPIVYLPQGFLNSLAENPEEINKILFTSIRETRLGQALVDAESKHEGHRNRIRASVEEIKRSSEAITRAKQEIGDLGSLDNLRADLKNFLHQKRKLSPNRLSDEDIKNLERLESCYSEIQNWEAPSKRPLDEYLGSLSDISPRPRATEKLETQLRDALDSAWRQASHLFKELVENSFRELETDAKLEHEAKREEYSNLEKLLEAKGIHLRSDVDNAELEDLETRIGEVRTQISALESAILQRDSAAQTLDQHLDDVLDARRDYLEYSRNLVDSNLNAKADGGLVSAHIEFGYRHNELDDLLHRKVTHRNTDSKVWSTYHEGLKGGRVETLKEPDLFPAVVSDILNDKVRFRANSPHDKFDLLEEVAQLLPAPALVGEYDGDRFGGFEPSTMSAGKRALAALSLILSDSSKNGPIIIDQPEDDLDSRSITDEILPFIRETRTKRQVIIVTHSANLAVGADSELVIVANQKSQEFPNPRKLRYYYHSGALESPAQTENKFVGSKSIRELICDYLDGGEEAFKNRAERYLFTK